MLKLRTEGWSSFDQVLLGWKSKIEKQELIDEIEADEKLTEFKQQEDNFVGLSLILLVPLEQMEQ